MGFNHKEQQQMRATKGLMGTQLGLTPNRQVLSRKGHRAGLTAE